MGSEQHLVWGHFCPSMEEKPFLALYAVPCEWWSFQLWLMRRALCEGLMLRPLMSTRCLVLSWDRVPFSQSDLPVRLLPTRPALSFNSQRPPGFGWVFHPRFLAWKVSLGRDQILYCLMPNGLKTVTYFIIIIFIFKNLSGSINWSPWLCLVFFVY